MSVEEKKSRKKKLNPENELVSKFFNKKDNNGEPKTKKSKLTESDENADDSLKFFKNKTGLKSAVATTSKDNVVSDFINKPSTSKKAATTKPKRATKPKKPKSQTDIRKVLSKQDQLVYHAINESCTEDGVDPYEMQLALAISESLKDVNKQEPKETKGFENPFTSSGKIQAVNTVLERYGFKSKKVYSDFEMEMFLNNKSKKRSKYQKFPTLLTRMTDQQRNEMITTRIHDTLDSYIFANTQESEKAQIEKKIPIVYSDELMEIHEMVNTAFRRSSEKMVHSDYYVTELFEISDARPGYLLKDWNKIAGRDPSPVKETKRRSTEIDDGQKDFSEICETKEYEKRSSQILSHNSSCSDIFEGIESFSMDQLDETPNEEVLKSVNEHLDLLHEKLSQSVLMLQDNEKISENNDNSDDKKLTSVDLAQDESINSGESTQEYIYNLPDTSKPAQESPEVIEQNEEMEQTPYNQKVPQIDDEIFGLTQHDSPNEEDIINRENGQSDETNFSTHSAAKSGEEEEIFDLTQCESSDEESPNMDCQKDPEVNELASIHENMSSSLNKNGEIFSVTQRDNENSKIDREKSSQLRENRENVSADEIFDLTQCASSKSLSKSSTKNSFDENEIINISDEEINYSINRCQDGSSSSSNDINGYPSNSFPTQQDYDIIEIDNIAEHSLIDMIAKDEGDVKIENSVSELLTNFSDYNRKSLNYSRKNRSIKFLESEKLDDSLADIMKKYGILPQKSPKNKSFSKIHSESDLERFSQRSIEKINDNDVDLTIINDISTQNDSQENEDSQKMNVSINKSLANILKSPMVKQSETSTKVKPRKSLGIILNDKYVIDTENLFIEPDYASMTPYELKQELFKYGIRPLPVKKAVELLTHIYNQMHPKIRIAIDEEIDMNDSRREMNITDVATDIGMKGDEDEFVFQLDETGITEDEEYILPKMKKSKVPTCLIPLHISFYNMVRSNDKLQKYILEYRPLDLDQIYKHFRKFDLTYQLNDIIAFLDKRCITFKTKEQSYSKKHERKKQKRTQKS